MIIAAFAGIVVIIAIRVVAVAFVMVTAVAIVTATTAGAGNQKWRLNDNLNGGGDNGQNVNDRGCCTSGR